MKKIIFILSISIIAFLACETDDPSYESPPSLEEQIGDAKKGTFTGKGDFIQ